MSMARTDLLFTLLLLAGFYRRTIEGYAHHILFSIGSSISSS